MSGGAAPVGGATIRNFRTVQFWQSAFVSCATAGSCNCGHRDCPTANSVTGKVRALVWYARQRNHDAIRLRRSRERWSQDNRKAAIEARDSLMRFATIARATGAAS